MTPFNRFLHAIRGAFFWDNPLELLLDYHLFRRGDPVRLIKGSAQILVNYKNSDMDAAKDVFLNKMYDAALIGSISNKMRGSFFRYLNLGGNIGAFDVKAGQIAGQHNLKTCGVALEMNTYCFARLVLNLELNQLLHIRAINAALWAKNGKISCDLCARDTGQYVFQAKDESGLNTQHVVALSWDSLWRDIVDDYDLVKVDIEGAEKFFLEGLTTEQARRMRYIVIETHSEELQYLCERRLTSLGFKLLEKTHSAENTNISFWRQIAPAL